MKSILMSIQPKWCALIANGKKTIEVRKTRPKIDTPFKCYIYETKGEIELPHIDYDGYTRKVGGKVIGEFVCVHIDRMTHCGTSNNDIKLRFEDNFYYTEIAEEFLFKCKLTYNDIEKYSNGGDVYGWHISNLKIYDKPKELSEFSSGSSRATFDDISSIVWSGMLRAPQSWCYVEEVLK